MDEEFDLQSTIEHLTHGYCIRIFRNPNAYAYLIREDAAPVAIHRASAQILVREGKLEIHERAPLYSDWKLRHYEQKAA
jgi:hypothetical protein